MNVTSLKNDCNFVGTVTQKDMTQKNSNTLREVASMYAENFATDSTPFFERFACTSLAEAAYWQGQACM